MLDSAGPSERRGRPGFADAGQKLGDIEKQNDVSIVLHRRPGEAKKDFLPKHENQLAKGDTLVVMSDLEHIQRLEGVNRTGAAR